MTAIIKKETGIALYTDKEIEAISKLEVSSQSYIKALMDSKLSVIPKTDAGNTIFEIIKVAEFDSGLTKLHNDDLIVLAKSTYDLILDSYPNLTIEEFKTACKKGALNEYGKWFGICLTTIVVWIKGYLNHEGRIKAIKEWNAKIDFKTSNVPVAALLDFNKKGALRAFERYKFDKQMPFGAYAYYDVINELIGEDYKGRKTLITDPKERKRICDEVLAAKEKVALQQKKENDRKGNYATSEKLMEAILNGFEGSIEKDRKSAFLKAFFDKLIKENKPLKL